MQIPIYYRKSWFYCTYLLYKLFSIPIEDMLIDDYQNLIVKVSSTKTCYLCSFKLFLFHICICSKTHNTRYLSVKIYWNLVLRIYKYKIKL